MSLIKCPDCKRMVSTNAHACPKCGFLIESYTLSKEEIDRLQQRNLRRKKCIKKVFISSFAIILSIILVGFCIGIGSEYSYIIRIKQEEKIAQEETKNKYPLFAKSSVLSVDPYGLSNENNILGQPISTILKGYIENEDYTINKGETYTSYTFTNTITDYPMGNDTGATLVIYTLNEKITAIQYLFRQNTDASMSALHRLICRKYITPYYDVDPIYAGYNYDNDKYVIMSRDEYNKTKNMNYYDITFISWQSTKGNAIYSFTNAFYEKDEYGAMTFTNNKTTIKEKIYAPRIPTL